MSRTHLYMLAMMPPNKLMEEIDRERQLFSTKYGFIKALKPPVHVTIYEPFKAVEDIEHRFSSLKEIVRRQVPFTVDLSNYGFFDHPSMTSPVIYIAVKNNLALNDLQKRILKSVDSVRKENGRLSSFTPHFTIGYRDVKWESFPQIKLEYSHKAFYGSFSCDAIFLWRHDGKNWQVQDTFKFEGTDEENQFHGQLDLF